LFFWLVAWLLSRIKGGWQLALAVALEACWEVFENTNFIIDRYRSETAALDTTATPSSILSETFSAVWWASSSLGVSDCVVL